MSDITIRNPVFDVPDQADLVIDPGRPDGSSFQHAMSMTMPYLEPYLIRTMREVAKKLPDGELRQDVRAFSGQEGNHYRVHMAMNDCIRNSLGEPFASQLREVEAELEADYKRFTKEAGLKYNVTYAAGFEAMTLAAARGAAKLGHLNRMLPWAAPIWAWHLAEEVEHRSVTFNVYKALYGSYAYRLWVGTKCQAHFASYIDRFAQIICEGITGRAFNPRNMWDETPTILRLFLPSLLPTYDPSKIPAPEFAVEVLQELDAPKASAISSSGT